MIFNFIVPGEVSISMGNTINEFLACVGVGDDARAEYHRLSTICIMLTIKANY